MDEIANFFNTIFGPIADLINTALTDLQTGSAVMLEWVTSFFQGIADMIRDFFSWIGF